MAKKVIVGTLASLLVIIVCAGAIIALVHSTKKARSDYPTSIHAISKAVRPRVSFCAEALHKESCELMLTQLSRNSQSSRDSRFEASLAQSPSAQTQIFRSFIEITLKELEIATNRSGDVVSAKMVGRPAAAMSDCQMLLANALYYTKAAVALVGDKDIESLSVEAHNIKHMLTMSMTFMYTCVDGFESPKLNSEMDRILNNASVTGSNALAVVDNIASAVGKSMSQHGTSRKLLGYDLDRQGYPTWLSAGDRKLLEATRYFHTNQVCDLNLNFREKKEYIFFT